MGSYRAYHKNGPQFVEHGAMVLSICVVVFLFLFLIQLSYRWIKGRIYIPSKQGLLFFSKPLERRYEAKDPHC